MTRRTFVPRRSAPISAWTWDLPNGTRDYGCDFRFSRPVGTYRKAAP